MSSTRGPQPILCEIIGTPAAVVRVVTIPIYGRLSGGRQVTMSPGRNAAGSLEMVSAVPCLRRNVSRLGTRR